MPGYPGPHQVHGRRGGLSRRQGGAQFHRPSRGDPLDGQDATQVVDHPAKFASRAVEMGQRVTKLERGVHSFEALAEMATRNGYRALGWTEGGALTPGSLADADNALASAIFATSNAYVRHLVVGGEPVVVDGTHVSIDVASELDSIIPKLMTS